MNPCKDDSCDAAHCPSCGGHKLDWYARGWCSSCQEELGCDENGVQTYEESGGATSYRPVPHKGQVNPT